MMPDGFLITNIRLAVSEIRIHVSAFMVFSASLNVFPLTAMMTRTRVYDATRRLDYEDSLGCLSNAGLLQTARIRC